MNLNFFKNVSLFKKDSNTTFKRIHEQYVNVIFDYTDIYFIPSKFNTDNPLKERITKNELKQCKPIELYKLLLTLVEMHSKSLRFDEDRTVINQLMDVK